MKFFGRLVGMVLIFGLMGVGWVNLTQGVTKPVPYAEMRHLKEQEREAKEKEALRIPGAIVVVKSAAR